MSEYKERFKTEFEKVSSDLNKLNIMIGKYREGTLPFKPASPVELYEEQAQHMTGYVDVLKKRAELEQIEL